MSYKIYEYRYINILYYTYRVFILGRGFDQNFLLKYIGTYLMLIYKCTGYPSNPIKVLKTYQHFSIANLKTIAQFFFKFNFFELQKRNLKTSTLIKNYYFIPFF